MLAINVSESEMGTAQKMTFSVKDFFSKCARIRRKLRIWSHLLKKSSTENFIFCAVGLFLSEWVYIFRSKINANFTKKGGFFLQKTRLSTHLQICGNLVCRKFLLYGVTH